MYALQQQAAQHVGQHRIKVSTVVIKGNTPKIKTGMTYGIFAASVTVVKDIFDKSYEEK